MIKCKVKLANGEVVYCKVHASLKELRAVIEEKYDNATLLSIVRYPQYVPVIERA